MSRTVPSARARSGVVNTSSVGRFVTWSCPQEVVDCAVFQRAAPRRPISSSVPGPVKRTASKPRRSRARPHAPRAPRCAPATPPRGRRHRGARRRRSPPTGARHRESRAPRSPTPRSGRRSPSRRARGGGSGRGSPSGVGAAPLARRERGRRRGTGSGRRPRRCRRTPRSSLERAASTSQSGVRSSSSSAAWIAWRRRRWSST